MNLERRINHKFYDVAAVEVCMIKSELCDPKTHSPIHLQSDIGRIEYTEHTEVEMLFAACLY